MRVRHTSAVKWKLIAASLGLLLAGDAMARAIQRHLPLDFTGRSGEVRTTACAVVTEQSYEDTAWWKGDGKNLEPQQRAVKSVFDAILRKDRKALDGLSEGGNSDKGRMQLDQMVKAADLLNGMDGVRLYEVAPLLIVYAHLHQGSRGGIGTFVFVKRNTNYSLLPVRPRTPGFELVRDWANSAWGVLKEGGPGYCSDEEVAKLDHRVTVMSGSDADIRVVLPVEMKVVPTLGKTISVGAASRVIRVYAQMKEAARKDSFARIISFIATPDAKNLGNFASDPAAAPQRAEMKSLLLNEDPVAVVDAGPLQVLYTRSKEGRDITPWYFLAPDAAEPQWANLAAFTTMDAIFKSGPLPDVARTDPTFEKLRKQPVKK